MCTEEMGVNVIPDFPILQATFPGGFSSFGGGVVDLLLIKLPSHYTPKMASLGSISQQCLTFLCLRFYWRIQDLSLETRGASICQ
jgi:hypothetical protein